jgi:hypothetical protein
VLNELGLIRVAFVGKKMHHLPYMVQCKAVGCVCFGPLMLCCNCEHGQKTVFQTSDQLGLATLDQNFQTAVQLQTLNVTY